MPRKQLWRERLGHPSGEAELGLGMSPCRKDGQLGPGLSPKMPDLWKSSCLPLAQTGSPGAGPAGTHAFDFFSVSKDISKSTASRTGEVIFVGHPSILLLLRLHLEYSGQFWILQSERHYHAGGSSVEGLPRCLDGWST